MGDIPVLPQYGTPSLHNWKLFCVCKDPFHKTKRLAHGNFYLQKVLPVEEELSGILPIVFMIRTHNWIPHVARIGVDFSVGREPRKKLFSSTVSHTIQITLPPDKSKK